MNGIGCMTVTEGRWLYTGGGGGRASDLKMKGTLNNGTSQRINTVQSNLPENFAKTHLKKHGKARFHHLTGEFIRQHGSCGGR